MRPLPLSRLRLLPLKKSRMIFWWWVDWILEHLLICSYIIWLKFLLFLSRLVCGCGWVMFNAQAGEVHVPIPQRSKDDQLDEGHCMVGGRRRGRAEIFSIRWNLFEPLRKNAEDQPASLPNTMLVSKTSGVDSLQYLWPKSSCQKRKVKCVIYECTIWFPIQLLVSQRAPGLLVLQDHEN